jgi:hypothetical protein
MNTQMNINGQLELGFNGSPQRGSKRRQQTRRERAAWWFAKMRAAVDNAIAWSAKPTPPPEQIWLTQ